MKILYHHRTRADDGQAVHIRSLQRAFRAEGHDVREFGLVAQGTETAATPAATAPPQRERWSLIGRLPRHLLELAEYGYSVAARGGLRRAAREFEPDFIYERYAFGNAAGVHTAERLGLPLFLEVNSPMVLELGRTRGLAYPRLARRTERNIFGRATRVVAVTQVLADILREEGVSSERLLVTPNGVELELYAEPGDAAARTHARRALGLGSEAGDGCVLGFVGYYRDWHRLDLAIAALREPGLESVELVLIGEGPAHAELQAAARAADVESRVHFAGRQAHTEIPRLLPAFDVGLVPAINPYASPLKLHEYMAAGLPTIAPDQPNLREVLTHDHDALLVPAGDADAFGQAVLDLARDAERRRRLGLAARATVESRDLTWRGNARRVIAAYEALPNFERGQH